MKRRLLAAVIFSLWGCGHVDTGQIDYRVAEAPGAVTDGALRPSQCALTDTDCRVLLPARIDRRYLPFDNELSRPFAAPEVYSIEIEQGVIGSNILEGSILGRQMGRSGEFAILANVFEFSPDAEQAAQRRFLESGEFEGTGDDPSDVELKLIYFGDNVQRRQPLNLSNIPLRPRTVYSGGSIGIQIVIMEVDAQNGPIASLLTTLARFGQQAIPGPSETRDMLFDLGESLFTGGTQDDRIFEYRFVLSAAGIEPGAVQATFVPGRYVLWRNQVRDRPMAWESLRLDHNTGRLLRNVGGSWEEYREDLYLVLNIRRFPVGTAPEHYDHQNWPAFRQLVAEVANADGAPINTLTQNFQTALVARRSTEWRSRLTQRWAATESRLRRYSSRTVTDLDNGLILANCDVTADELRRRSGLAERDARDALREFVADYRTALQRRVAATTSTAETEEFSLADREAIVSLVSRFFVPWSSEVNAELFTDAASFERVFIASGAQQDLPSLALTVAAGRGTPATNCQGLIQRGLARSERQ